MNKVILMGRLTRDPEVRYSSGDSSMAIARYSLAVDRRGRRNGNGDEPTTDFFNCVAFGRQGEFAEKYLKKGMKIAVTGRIQTGSYTNEEGQKVNTVDIVVEDHEFCESKNASSENAGFVPAAKQETQTNEVNDGFMNIPDGIEEELPFN